MCRSMQESGKLEDIRCDRRIFFHYYIRKCLTFSGGYLKSTHCHPRVERELFGGRCPPIDPRFPAFPPPCRPFNPLDSPILSHVSTVFLSLSLSLFFSSSFPHPSHSLCERMTFLRERKKVDIHERILILPSIQRSCATLGAYHWNSKFRVWTQTHFIE